MSQDKERQIKEAIRQLHVGIPPEQVKEEFREVLETALLCDLLQSHFFKENSILYPAALSVVTKEEWLEARENSTKSATAASHHQRLSQLQRQYNP